MKVQTKNYLNYDYFQIYLKKTETVTINSVHAYHLN